MALFLAEGNAPLRPSEGSAGGDRFNAFTGQVTGALGAPDWESLPDDFESQFASNQIAAPVQAAENFFAGVSQTTTDFFASVTAPPLGFGPTAPEATPPQPAVPSNITNFFEQLFPGIFGTTAPPAAVTPAVTAPAVTTAPASSSGAFAAPAVQTVAPAITAPTIQTVIPNAPALGYAPAAISPAPASTVQPQPSATVPSTIAGLVAAPANYVGPTIGGQIWNDPTIPTAPALAFGPGSNPATDLISNILTGNNTNSLTPSGGVVINSVTNAPQTTTLLYDQSNNSTSTSSITYSSQATVNQADIVKNVLDGVRGFFGTVQASPQATPSNDAVYTAGAMYPGSITAGQAIDPARSVQGSLVSPVATVSGNLSTTFADPAVRRLAIFSVLIGLVGLYFIFRKRG